MTIIIGIMDMVATCTQVHVCGFYSSCIHIISQIKKKSRVKQSLGHGTPLAGSTAAATAEAQKHIC